MKPRIEGEKPVAHPQQKSAAKRIQVAASPAEADAGQGNAAEHRRGVEDPVSAGPATGESKGTVTKLRTTPRTIAIEDATTVAAGERTVKGEQLYAQPAELFENGRYNEDCFKRLQLLMREAGHTSDAQEWAMGAGFLEMVLPLLERLGDARSRAYLQHLLGDLRGSTAAELRQKMHPDADS